MTACQSLVECQPIAIGYEWRVRIAIPSDPPPFPAGAAVKAEVRAKRTDTTAKATLTTAGGGVVIVDETTIEIVIGAAATAAMTPGTVSIDFARTDTATPAYLGIALTVPVMQPVTRP